MSDETVGDAQVEDTNCTSLREEGLDRQTWWPAGRDNDPAQMLGMTGEDAED